MIDELRAKAVALIEDTIWATLESQDEPMGGPYVDRDVSMIDASGSAVDMTRVAEAIVKLIESDTINDVQRTHHAIRDLALKQLGVPDLMRDERW